MRQLDKNVGILIVDPVSGVASTVKRVLSELGYKNIFQADSVLDGFNTMIGNKIEWIISSLFHGQKLNGWHFLRLPLEFEGYQSVMTSVLLNSDEAEYAPTLYSLGMASAHLRPITYNSFKAEIDRYLQRLKSSATIHQAIASDLRDHLSAKNSIDELERLEMGLYKWADSSPQQRLRVIHSQLKAGNNLEALLGMKQLLSTNPECEANVGELSKRYLKIDDVADYKSRINVQLAVIVDSDEAQQKFVGECLREIGVKELRCFDSPAEACEFFKEGQSIDLLVCEWKLHGMDGAGFIQHAKNSGMGDKPTVVYSAQVGDDDFKLIKEIGGIFVLKKTMPKKAFKEEVGEFFSRWRFPVEGEDIEQKICQSLEAGDSEYARQLMVQFEVLPTVEKQRKVTLKAYFAYYAGQFKEAKALIIESSRIKLPTHREIGLLGKILLKLGDFADAQKCFEQANQMVPGNLERLCSLADVSAELGKDQDTMKYISAAQSLAGDAPLVTMTFARHAAALGKADEAQQYMADVDVARGVVAHMNNLGVAFASTGKWKESVESYVKAIKALGNLHEDLLGTVYYNLGLSLARQGRLKDALPVLKNAASKAGFAVAKKAARLTERVQQSMDTLQPLAFKDGTKEIAVEVHSASQIPKTQLEEYLATQSLKAGDHGLFLIYVPSQQMEIDLSSEFPKVIKKTA